MINQFKSHNMLYAFTMNTMCKKNITLIPQLHLYNQLKDACIDGDAVKVKKLIAYQVNVNLVDYFGRTAIMYAAIAGKVNIIKILTENFAIFTTVRDREGKTALWFAAANGHIESVEFLLQNGAKMISDYKFRNPLWIAAANGHEKIVEMFFKFFQENKRGLFSNKEGISALEIAKRNQHFSVVKVITDYLNLNLKEQAPKEQVHIANLKILADRYFQNNLNCINNNFNNQKKSPNQRKSLKI